MMKRKQKRRPIGEKKGKHMYSVVDAIYSLVLMKHWMALFIG